MIRILVIAAVLAGAAPVAARPCEDEAAALREHLTIERARTKKWNTAWAIAFGAAAAGQLGLALAGWTPLGEFERDDQDTLYVGAGKATLGMAARIVLPLKVEVPAPAADACTDVVILRDALATAGRRERRSFWLTHLGGMSLNLAAAAFLTYRHSFTVGALSFAISFPVGPISAYTQPRRSWQKWRDERGTWAAGITPSAGSDPGWTVWLGGTW